MSNRYKEQFTRGRMNVCPLLEFKIPKIPGFIGNVVAKLATPVMNAIYRPGNKFPERCPIPTVS